MRCRAPGGIHGNERLSFCVDSDVRVMLQHAAREVTADGLERVVRHAHLGQLGHHGVSQDVRYLDVSMAPDVRRALE
jgi:hypothetical protein